MELIFLIVVFLDVWGMMVVDLGYVLVDYFFNVCSIPLSHPTPSIFVHYQDPVPPARRIHVPTRVFACSSGKASPVTAL